MSIRHVLALTLAAALGACGGAQKTEQPATTAPSEQQPGGATTPEQGAQNMPGAGQCPMEVPGTQVTVEDAEGGVAMRFTTTGDTAEVRRRVEQMAAMQESHAGMMGQNAPGERHPVGGQPEIMTIPHTTRSEDVEGGALMVMTPSDPGQLDELRTATRDWATKMQTGQCPMMQHQGGMNQGGEGGGDTGGMQPQGGGMQEGGSQGEDTGSGE
jgi:hypothetical protein